MSAQAEDFTAWERQISTAGACTHPIRLRGGTTAIDRATGEARTAYTTATEPGGVLHVACGNRRESVCPSCSGTYKRDTRHIILEGLQGGSTLPASVAEHPCVFATLTAPGFGPVHSRRERNGVVLACNPRRDASKRACRLHGHDVSCPVRHAKDDPRLGRPLCPDCYDYESAVVFNANASKLWRRFITYLPRELASLGGVTQRELKSLIKARFVKVSEYQARGVIHYHAIIRLDLATDDGTYAPPPDGWTADVLAAAITAASRSASIVADVGNTGRTLRLRFGHQVDTRIINRGTAGLLTQDAVANYIAKYVTKTADVPGLPAYRLRSFAEVRALRCPPHTRRMIETAWLLGYGRWAHQLGAGGHPVTKSRRFSVTYADKRHERRVHRKAQRYPDGELDPWGRQVDDSLVLFVGDWHYAGSGYQASDAHFLALMSADSARQR
ncbi:MAG TPA: replication initiator [Streptosporangiaceae bacterium]|nr:replication initiator [Streptosporangiaceae bacterium]